MAYIPYGYRIERGKAVIDEEAAERIRTFTENYLDGDSFVKACEAAELPVCVCTMKRAMEKGTYLGDDYYPPILDADTCSRFAEERESRYEKLGHFAENRKGPEKAVPVKTHFCIVPIEENTAGETAAEKAAFLYSCIRPSPSGSRNITSADRAELMKMLK